MQQAQIDAFLAHLEGLIPPSKGAHHAIVRFQYGSDESGWEPRLGVLVNDGEMKLLRRVFFDPEELDTATPAGLALAIADLFKGPPAENEQVDRIPSKITPLDEYRDAVKEALLGALGEDCTGEEHVEGVQCDNCHNFADDVLEQADRLMKLDGKA